MKKKQSIFLHLSTVTYLFMTGCTPTSDIKNQTLRDRVCSCSGGFSSDVGADLQLAYDKASIKGDAGASFKEESKAIIFSQLPEQDRLKAYEDYIACIENDWNKDKKIIKSKLRF